MAATASPIRRAISVSLSIALATTSFSAYPITMREMFDDINAVGNVTSPGAYKGQSMNYVTGGSLYMRTPQKTLRPLNITLPSIKAGCGGIDLQAGGFSFINTDELIANLRNVMANASGYFFKLAIQNLCAPCDNIMTGLKGMADAVNQFGINSCESAKGVVNMALGDAWQKGKDNTARILGNYDNTTSDFAASMTKFKTGISQLVDGAASETKAKVEEKQNNPSDPLHNQAKEEVFVGNITWEAIKALKANTGADINEQQQKMMLALVGTIVGDLDRPARQITRKPIKISTLVGEPGETTKLIELAACDTTDKCLGVGTASENITPYYRIVEEKLNLIASAVENRSLASLPNDAKMFIEVSSIPVLRMVNIATSMKSASSARAMMANYTGVIAAGYASQYIMLLLDGVEEGMKYVSLRYSDPKLPPLIAELRKTIASIRSEVMAQMTEIQNSAVRQTNIAEQLQVIERSFYTSVSPGTQQNIMFSLSAAR